MSALILALSIMLGYRFARKMTCTRFKLLRQKDQHIYFYSAIYGILLLAIAYVITITGGVLTYTKDLYDPNGCFVWISSTCGLKWSIVERNVRLFSENPTGTNLILLFLLVLIGLIAPCLVNRIIGKDKIQDYFLDSIDDLPLDLFLFIASSDGLIVALETDDNMVHVGMLEEEDFKVDKRSITLVPYYLGQWVNGKYVQVANYLKDMASYENLTLDDLEDTIKVISMDHIVSVGLYNDSIYDT